MTGAWQTGRAAIFTALSLLEQEGYTTERVSGNSRYFDIIAWKDKKILCIVVRSSRRYTISCYPEHLATLSELIKSGSAPGDVQFWLYRNPGWFRYAIHPGGATLLYRRKE